MNTSVVWNDQVPERDGVRNPINDTAISPGLLLEHLLPSLINSMPQMELDLSSRLVIEYCYIIRKREI